uniref:C2 domain-containing protein n=1 Tax=Zosterops lateralis melanops TaxID=1220523 RepID=A0A8D2P9U6_ZOSLA
VPLASTLKLAVVKRTNKWEKHPYYNLTVKVLRARNIKGTDVLSKADCYVELKLPTASPGVSRTQVVDNSENPEWNETFQYRIHSAVKVRTLCGAGWTTCIFVLACF